MIGGRAKRRLLLASARIVSAIGKADDHMQVLENPDQIAAEVLGRQLDANTAFEIVSIDIADIDVGENVEARLRADQAEADTRVARARAEGRRAQAVAAEQEQYARIEESRAKLVDAEAEVPKAMADSFGSGRLGILDYYKLRNVQADTNMRRSIAGRGCDAAGENVNMNDEVENFLLRSSKCGRRQSRPSRGRRRRSRRRAAVSPGRPLRRPGLFPHGNAGIATR